MGQKFFTFYILPRDKFWSTLKTILTFIKTEVSSTFYNKSKILYTPEHKFLKTFLYLLKTGI